MDGYDVPDGHNLNDDLCVVNQTLKVFIPISIFYSCSTKPTIYTLPNVLFRHVCIAGGNRTYRWIIRIENSFSGKIVRFVCIL